MVPTLLTIFCGDSRSLSYETSSRKYHNVVTVDKAAIKKRKMAFLEKLKIRNSDLDIIEVDREG